MEGRTFGVKAAGGGVAELAAGLVGLAGVVLGVWLSARVGASQRAHHQRESLTLELYSEFQSETMLRSRISAFRSLSRYAPINLKVLLRMQEELDTDEWFHVSRVLHFFEVYAVYLAANRLDNTLDENTMKRYLDFWMDRFMGDLLASIEESSGDEWVAWASALHQSEARAERGGARG